MTREEAIAYFKDMNECTYGDVEPIQMAIKALEQEPCEDCISRQAAIDALMSLTIYKSKREIVQAADKDENSWIGGVAECIDEIEDLPPVTPTHKKGYWINKSHKSGCGITFIASECTCCGKKTFFNCDELIYRFCPNCGAEMEAEE